MWFKEFTRIFYKIKNVANGEINEWSFSNPHTWPLASPKHNNHGMALLSRSVFNIRKVKLMISVKWWTWTDKLRKCFGKSNIYPVTKQTLLLFWHIQFIIHTRKYYVAVHCILSLSLATSQYQVRRHIENVREFVHIYKCIMRDISQTSDKQFSELCWKTGELTEVEWRIYASAN